MTSSDRGEGELKVKLRYKIDVYNSEDGRYERSLETTDVTVLL